MSIDRGSHIGQGKDLYCVLKSCGYLAGMSQVDQNRKDANQVHKLEESNSLSFEIWKTVGGGKSL